MSVPASICSLVKRFSEQREAYRSGNYNETQLRREFLDPFFKALGWDIDNEQGYAEAYKDVIHEDRLKIGSWTKAPDYSFRIGGTRKFFVEAKRPSVDVKETISPAFQLRRYAWSAKLSVSILSDFEEFAVYDCRIRPQAHDKASVSRIIYFRFDEYPEKWNQIEEIFSREAVLKGSFDIFADAKKKGRGTSEVDESFLADIEDWRAALAGNLALRNADLTQREVNFAVQRTIDRIIFLRICEDRGIEDYGRLQALQNGPNTYDRLVELFQQADLRYNSGLFYFRSEKDRHDAPDELTPSLRIDDRVLKDIFAGLYYPASPYEFSVLPADILGQVYEQFLGKVIRLTAGHRAVIDEKPEVRKSGGVYYTPTNVVNYIVDQTVGQLLKDAGTPKRAASIRILDPACGSGSFLIAAYEKLLTWHRDWYLMDGAEKHARGKEPKVFRGRGAEWRLTTTEKKRILVNSIFGVDIDPQAVDVTKLSLVLKVLEAETSETLQLSLSLFHQRALPDLSNNIKCGNSLVAPDFYLDSQLDMLDEQLAFRINAFDWYREFPTIVGDGTGFDAVIGNPPYLSYSGRQAIALEAPVREYMQRHYPSAGWQTAHGFFIAKAHTITSRFVGFIVPDQVGHLEGYEAIRAVVSKNSSIKHVRYWGEDVFKGVVTPALTFVSDKKHNGLTTIESTDGLTSTSNVSGGAPWIAKSPNSELISKLRAQAAPLDESFADPGVHTGNCSQKLIIPIESSTPDAVPVLEGKQVDRYVCARPKKALRLGYSRRDGEYFTIRPVHRYTEASFVVRQTAAYPIVGPRLYAEYFRNSLLALYPPPDGRDIRFVVGVLNSRLMRFVYTASIKESGQKAFPQVKVRSLRSMPVRSIDFASALEKSAHDRVVSLVDELLKLRATIEDMKPSHERDVVSRKAREVDEEIDRCVERLYGLSVAEIAQIEGRQATFSR